MVNQRGGMPFQQRFCRGTVYARDSQKVYVRLADSRWAKTAVVTPERLPEGSKSSAFNEGDEVELFLLYPHGDSPDQWFASIRWAEPSGNPWETRPPTVGELRTVRVDRMPRPYLAMGVCEATGIDIRIDRHELPVSVEQIGNLLDVGDQVEVEITAIDRERLRIEGSVSRAMRRRATYSDAESQRALLGSIVARQSRLDWRRRYRWPDPGPGPVGLAVRDGYFGEHLVRWLDVFDFEALQLGSSTALLTALHAPDRPERLLLSPGLWPSDRRNQQELRARLGRVQRLVWLGRRPAGLGPEVGIELSQPFLLADLLNALAPVSPTASSTLDVDAGPAGTPVIADRAEQLAYRYLQRLCEACDLSAALWVEQISEVNIITHGQFGIDENKLQAVLPKLNHSFLSSSLQQQTPWIQVRCSPRDMLHSLQPSDCDQISVVPFPKLLEDGMVQAGEVLPAMRHAVVLFHRRPRDGVSVVSPVHHISGLQAALEAHELAQENANLGRFALIGKNWSAYLHETRQSAQVLLDKVEELAEVGASGLPIGAEHWQTLRKDARHLYRLVDDEIDVIRRQQKARLSVRPMVEHTAGLMLHQFDMAGCAFTVRVPDLPLLLSLPPIVLDQSLRNLLDNALYFAQRRGEPGGAAVAVRVSLGEGADQGRTVLIDVEDNGPGVRYGDRAGLFAPRDSNKGRVGTGLGLHFCRALLRQHGGDLVLHRSLRWRSTVFRIVLPILLEGR